MTIKAYTDSVNPSKVHQSEALTANQVKNPAGGYVFQVDDWVRLNRFLILGSEGGTYYASERKITRENAQVIERLISEDSVGVQVVNKIVEISQSGRAPKNDPAIFALGMCLKLGFEQTRKAAQSAVIQVCRTGTHLFQLAEVVCTLGGWGRITKKAISSWYVSKFDSDLGYQLVKYQQRGGWSHRDLSRLSHAKPVTAGQNALMAYVTGKEHKTNLPGIVVAFEDAKKLALAKEPAREMAKLILETSLPRECIPTEYLNSPEVWEALIPTMGLTALIRNLGKMTNVGLLTPNSDIVKQTCSRLSSANELKKARIHPMNLLVAQKIYTQGHGDKGKLSWTPVQRLVEVLEEAYYKSFSYVESTNKRWLLGLDVSGSMGSPVAGLPLSCREAACAMALVTARTEEQYVLMGFQDRFVKLDINKTTSLIDAVKKVDNLSFGGTDCAEPILYASRNKIPVDCFAIYTDNETWCGNVHPVQALKDYRQKFGIGSKLIVQAFTSTGFSIADPNDSGMLDLVGLDSATPQLIADFARE